MGILNLRSKRVREPSPIIDDETFVSTEEDARAYDPTKLSAMLLEHRTFFDDPEGLRKEFHIALIELADKFDSLDHKYGPWGGTVVQEDCFAVRALARSLAAESNAEAAVEGNVVELNPPLLLPPAST